MSNSIVVLGGGTGGTLIANRLRCMLGRGAADIVVIACSALPRQA
jgi:NADH dehydrogenase FAD-containing subunit